MYLSKFNINFLERRIERRKRILINLINHHYFIKNYKLKLLKNKFCRYLKYFRGIFNLFFFYITELNSNFSLFLEDLNPFPSYDF